jgi:hypothetical protein
MLKIHFFKVITFLIAVLNDTREVGLFTKRFAAVSLHHIIFRKGGVTRQIVALLLL